MSWSTTRERRWEAVAAVTPVTILVMLVAIWLLHDAPFLQAGAWATGIGLLAVALLLPALAVFTFDLSGRSQAERTLRQNEERLRQVGRVSHIGIFDHDHLTGEIYWSPEQRKIYGWGPDEPVTFSSTTGRGPETWNLIHPEDRERVAAALKRAHTNEEGPFDIEYRIIRRDGSLRWVTTRSQTFFQGEGAERRAVRSIGAVQDITERKRAEEAVAMFRHSIDRASDAIFWVNRDGGFDYVNDAACRSLGYTRKELLALRLWEVDTVYTKERWLRQWELWESAGKDSVEYFEGFHRRKDGTVFPIEAEGQHIWSAGGHSLHVGYVRNITERKRAEQALRESEERLRQVARVYNIGVLDHHLVTGRLYWSPELRGYLGVDPDAPAALSRFIDAIHPDDRPRVEEEVQRALDPAGDGRFDVQHRVVAEDGSVRWLESRAQTYFSSDGGARHPVRTVGAMVDITARVASEEALRESLHEKETLLREVHHRVKNNLQIIASLLHFQAKKIRDPDDLAAFFEGRDRLRSMILVHEKLYQSRGLTRIDFGNYLQSLAGELQRSHDARSGKRVDVRVTADEIALPIELALPCGMIVCELLTNVFKYAFPGDDRGSAHIQLVALEGQVRLTVSDDGVGLPPEFDPEHSTSFGWQLIHNLAAQLGGRVSVSGEGGTRVSISFARQSVDH